MDIQVEERHKQECKDKWSTQLNLVIIFRHRANSFQLSRADHYKS